MRKVPGILPSISMSMAVVVSFSPWLAFASEPSELANVKECRAIVSDASRLRCYDAIVDGGKYRQEDGQQEVRAPERRIPATEEAAPADNLKVSIIRIQTGQGRISYFHTADGVIWKQTGRGSWNLAVPFDAVIKKGALGSYFLVTDGGKSTRVKRVD